MAIRNVTPDCGSPVKLSAALLQRVGGVRADHDELAVGQVDDVHQPEGQRETQRDQQQD